MPVIKSKLKTAGADFSAARDAMRERIAQLEQITANTMQGGGEAARARHISRGKMLPRERVAGLLDAGTPFLELSPLAAFFHTEIGPLNQIIHIWPYKDLAEREQIRDEAVKRGIWPPKIGEFLQEQQTDIFKPLAISPEMKPGNLGPYFEMRTYTLESGELPVLTKAWENAIEERVKVSPVVAVWISEIGGLNKFCHIWQIGRAHV